MIAYDVLSTDDEERAADALRQGLEALTLIQGVGASDLPARLLKLDQADFRTAALGMFVELGELVNECQWKPWRRYAPPTADERQKALKELGDVLHFLAWMLRNLEERLDINESDVALAFIDVARENRRRFTGQVAGREPPSSPNGSEVVGSTS